MGSAVGFKSSWPLLFALQRMPEGALGLRSMMAGRVSFRNDPGFHASAASGEAKE